MDNNDLVGITGTLEHETERAYLMDLTPPVGKIWVPKSQAKDVTKLDSGQFYMEIPQWLAQEKGL